MSTCARCGHTTPTCTRCGQNDELLGGRIRGREYCHTFSASPSCYTQQQWEDTVEGLAQARADDTVSIEVIAGDFATRAAAEAAVHQEDDWFIAQATSVDVASQGRTEEEARANLREAVELYLTERWSR